MEITIPLFSGISLRIAGDPTTEGVYPTGRLQKGLLLMDNDHEVAEEGVGFGVPLLMRGRQTICPGCIELASLYRGSIQEVTALFRINLEEKLVRPGFESINSDRFYTIKNFLAELIRRFPPLRGLLTTLSNVVRWMSGWETTYEEAEFSRSIKVIYSIDRSKGKISVEVDSTGLLRDGITEVIVMNEQGASIFDHYRDSSGTSLLGEEIGCWDKINADWASFVSESHRLAFTLRQVEGATLFRGRELVNSRLAWAGFGYSFPPTIERLSFEVKIDRLP